MLSSSTRRNKYTESRSGQIQSNQSALMHATCISRFRPLHFIQVTATGLSHLYPESPQGTGEDPAAQ